MATKTTRSTKSKSEERREVITENTEETQGKSAEAPSQSKADEKQKYHVRKQLDPNMVVIVRNGYQGVLVYKSRKTGERFIWSEFGSEQDMELQELRNARNSSKAFFENNWFLIDDPEVIDYLGVSQYYRYALNFDTFDDLFKKTPDEIKEIVGNLSKGQKKSVAYRAKQLIADEKIDSIKVINALEECLSVQLIER